MKTTLIAWAALLLAPWTALRAAEAPPAARPNILFIVADDLGYGDLGCQGLSDFRTPHMDSIARNGVRFTSGYSTCTVCSPSRAALMTGRYQTRFGHEFQLGGEERAEEILTPDHGKGLPLSEITMAARLQAAGYRTGALGKWHLGDDDSRHPLSRGFDEFLGFLGGSSHYRTNAAQRTKLLRGRAPDTGTNHLTEAFAEEAARFIARHAGRPFFLYLAFNAVHLPLETTPEYLARVKDIKDRTRRVHAAQTVALDDAVGRVLRALREAGLEENTLVFLLSDNGGTLKARSSNQPLRGEKHTYYEGGIRVPFLAQWKGRLPAGRVVDAPVVTFDATATALAVAGVDTRRLQLDGVNLLPLLRGEAAPPPHETICWRWGAQWAIRHGDWKLTCTQDAKDRQRRPPVVQLFNLAKDLGETRNLMAKQPQKAAELRALWDQWNAEQSPPLWPDK